jgi:hypothetical protein
MDIKCKYETTFLGLRLTEYITWEVHIKNLSSKLSDSYYVMQPLKSITSVQILRCTYFVNFLGKAKNCLNYK